jgi:hypothetical protein
MRKSSGGATVFYTDTYEQSLRLEPECMGREIRRQVCKYSSIWPKGTRAGAIILERSEVRGRVR